MDLQLSVDKILRQPDLLGETFYEIFFERFPTARPFFAKTDWRRQKLVLTMAVPVIAQNHLHGYAVTKKYLAYLGTHHHQRGIPEEMLPFFSEALLATLQRVLGDDWTPALAGEWAAALDLACREMTAGYRQHVTI